ncbi:MAG: low molecular weight protein-tyrosine-phosphatase [Rikenellaceae bacterium]
MKQKILFVCLGNICRSPAAEGVLRSMVEREGLTENFEIDSAGTYGGHAGDSADPRMREAAFIRGYRLMHRSRRVEMEDFLHFDRIIVMDDNNLRDVERLAPSPEAKLKIERFVSLCRNHPDSHYVPDPYYEGREGFEKVLDLLEDGCAEIISACKC